MAANTWRTYRAGINALQQFQLVSNLPTTWPVPVDQLLHFIAYLSISGKSARTAASYISALATIMKLNNFPDSTQHFVVRKALTGMSRLSQRVDPRLPITLPLLQQIITTLPAICNNHYEVCLFSAAYLLAFFGFFRVSELVAASTGDLSQRACSHSDISFAPDFSSLQVHLRTSKTDQLGQGTTTSLIPPCARSQQPALTST